MSNPNITVESVLNDMVKPAILKTAHKTDHERIMAAIGDLSKIAKTDIDEIRNDLLREIENREPVCAVDESHHIYRGWDGELWCEQCEDFANTDESQESIERHETAAIEASNNRW